MVLCPEENLISTIQHHTLNEANRTNGSVAKIQTLLTANNML
jgi:hypothetical protein